MSREVLSAQPRDAAGKSPVARRLRRTGQVPGVLYKRGESLPFSVNSLEMSAILRHGTTLIDVEISGNKHTSVIKEYQVHPVRGHLMHIDLQEVAMDERLRSVVSIVLVGEAAGVRAGGILSQPVHELNIESTPGNIPETIEVDVTALEMGETLHLSEVTPPEGVVFVDDEGTALVNITQPRIASVDEEVAAEAGEGAAAPADDAADATPAEGEGAGGGE